MIRSKNSLLPKLSITRPVTVIMTLIALLVVGFIAFTQIPTDLMPSGFSAPFLGVWTPYPNSNPQEVEEQIAKPIEDQIQTISGIRRVVTNSNGNGCWTFIQFAQGTDMDLAYAQLRDRMDRVKRELPDGIERLYLQKWDNDDEPILWIALIETEPHDDPYLLVEQHLQKPLERVDGVAKVEIWGAEEKSVLLYINQDLVKSYKINLFEVIQRLRNDNFSVSSGYVKEGQQKIYVRSIGKFRSLDEIRNLPIRDNLKLKDVAEIKYDVPERKWRQRIDNKSAITLGVFKESVANSVALCEDVARRFEDEFKNDPKLSGFRTEILFNQGEFITDSVDNLERTALWGGLFAFFILYFFLRRFRMTLIVILAIPLSLLMTLTVLYFMDWSLNLITMMGLMISVGMVVDNSIVVLENIYRKRAEGIKGNQASLEGTSEVALAVTLATLTTVVVFLPLILMNDNAGFQFYMFRIGMPVMVSLIASLFVAMVFIPLAATRIVSKREVQEPRSIVKSNHFYQKTLSWAVSHRIEMFVILIIAMVSMQFAASNTKQTDDMEGNINDFRLIFDLPDNNTIENTERIIKQVEDSIRVKKEIYGVRTIMARHSNNWGMIRIFLHAAEKKDWYEVAYENVLTSLGLYEPAVMERKEVIEDVKKRLPNLPGVEISTSWHSQGGGGDEASLAITLYGDDTTTLVGLSKEVERRLRSIGEIISIETDREKGSDEIHLEINREQAKKYGISPTAISGTVQYALRGIPLPKYQTENKEIDVHIQLREEDRRNLSQLKNLTFFTQSGKEIPLDAVATFTVRKGIGEVKRENGKTFLTVKANTTEDNMGALYGKVDQVMKGFEMPYGYTWSKGQNFQRMQEGNESMKFAMILSITFVFLLMGFLFESFVLPLSVILSIPFSFLGAFWIMFLTGTPIDLMSQIGFVILVGIVVNNAIVLIDLINRLRNEGMSRYDAIMEAGKQRFRPILMTAFTTIGGLLPMAIGNTAMIGIPYSPMGRTIIGGLLTSTLLSLIAVPWAYTLFDDMRVYFKKLTALYIYKPKQEATAELAQAE